MLVGGGRKRARGRIGRKNWGKELKGIKGKRWEGKRGIAGRGRIWGREQPSTAEERREEFGGVAPVRSSEGEGPGNFLSDCMEMLLVFLVCACRRKPDY